MWDCYFESKFKYSQLTEISIEIVRCTSLLHDKIQSYSNVDSMTERKTIRKNKVKQNKHESHQRSTRQDILLPPHFTPSPPVTSPRPIFVSVLNQE